MRAALLMFGLCLAAGPALAQSDGERYQACLDKTESDPDTAYEDALIWRDEGGGTLARHCVAVALLELGHEAEAASRLEALADSPVSGSQFARVELYSQSGNAFLLADQPGAARRAFDKALQLADDVPSLYIDRARAAAMTKDYNSAENDLTRALELQPGDPLALTLRAEARLQQGEVDGAEADAQAAVEAAPQDVNARLVLGDVREMRRTGDLPGRLDR